MHTPTAPSADAPSAPAPKPRSPRRARADIERRAEMARKEVASDFFFSDMADEDDARARVASILADRDAQISAAIRAICEGPGAKIDANHSDVDALNRISRQMVDKLFRIIEKLGAAK